MKKKRVSKSGVKKYTIDIDMTILSVQECGYKATFTEQEHIDFVTHMLENLEGYKRLTRTLSKAIDLIAKD